MSHDMPTRRQLQLGYRAGKEPLSEATLGAALGVALEHKVTYRKRETVRVPVSTKTGTEYTYDTSTGQLRRRFPKPDRHKKVRRRLRDQARALATRAARKVTRP